MISCNVLTGWAQIVRVLCMMDSDLLIQILWNDLAVSFEFELYFNCCKNSGSGSTKLNAFERLRGVNNEEPVRGQ